MQVELSEETARLVDTLAQAGYGSVEEVVARAVDLLNETDRRYVERMVQEAIDDRATKPAIAGDEVLARARALVAEVARRRDGAA